jgi:hypothetical protein
MSGADTNARREVNNAIVNTGSKGQIVDTHNSSIEKRRKNKEERAAISPTTLFPISRYYLYRFGIFTLQIGESYLRAREL